MAKTAILDIDGTLVDTNYQHALAWFRAFRMNGIVVPLYRIHRHVGMGGDQVVVALAGEDVERDLGDDIRSAHDALYMAGIDEVEPLEGARDLVVALKERGATIVLASSARDQEVDHYLDLLDARDLADAWTTSADVESTKPAPDLVVAALEKAGSEADDAALLGDTPWDCEAAAKAGVPTVALLTGGFSEQELRDAGAVEVFTELGDLLERLDETPLG